MSTLAKLTSIIVKIKRLKEESDWLFPTLEHEERVKKELKEASNKLKNFVVYGVILDEKTKKSSFQPLYKASDTNTYFSFDFKKIEDNVTEISYSRYKTLLELLGH